MPENFEKCMIPISKENGKNTENKSNISHALKTLTKIIYRHIERK